MTKSKITILGIESSCDDTAVGVVCCANQPRVLSNAVFTQSDLHAPFGGVVPELAARAHAEKLDIVTQQALDEAQMTLAQLDGIAVTAGPGLIGGLLAGVAFAKGLAAGCNLPFIGVNHLAGHALTPRFSNKAAYPYLMLLVSGGHCLFLIVHNAIKFTRLGGTIDDAPGEAFDKTAKLLGLGYPGGPQVEREATKGDPNAYKFARPLSNRADCNLSFSGLKTSLRRVVDVLSADQGGIHKQQRADLCASFQAAVADCLSIKVRRAMAEFIAVYPDAKRVFAVAGGVAANQMIGAQLRQQAQAHCFEFIAPPLQYCTDNGAMIAWAGLERFQLGLINDYSLCAYPRWPLDSQAQPMLGSGKRGVKA